MMPVADRSNALFNALHHLDQTEIRSLLETLNGETPENQAILLYTAITSLTEMLNNSSPKGAAPQESTQDGTDALYAPKPFAEVVTMIDFVLKHPQTRAVILNSEFAGRKSIELPLAELFAEALKHDETANLVLSDTALCARIAKIDKAVIRDLAPYFKALQIGFEAGKAGSTVGVVGLAAGLNAVAIGESANILAG